MTEQDARVVTHELVLIGDRDKHGRFHSSLVVPRRNRTLMQVVFCLRPVLGGGSVVR